MIGVSKLEFSISWNVPRCDSYFAWRFELSFHKAIHFPLKLSWTRVVYRDFCFTCVDYSFSSTLIIQEEKTKEITTVKEIWLCDPNCDKIRWTFALNFSKNYSSFESPRRVFHQMSKLEKTRQRLAFSTLFSVFGIRWNTPSRVWYIT